MSQPDMMGFPPGQRVEFERFALSDLTTSLTTGTSIGYFVPSFDLSVVDLVITNQTTSSSGNPTVDLKVDAASILSVLPSILAGALSSAPPSSTPPVVIARPDIKRGQLVTFDITVAGTTAKGLQATLFFVRRP